MYAEFTAEGRRTPVRVATLTANMAAALELDFPEIEFATRLAPAGGTLRQGDREVAPSFFFWADPDFFRMFPVKALAGDVNAALSRPDGLVLTRRMARQLFNREDVLGEAVTVNRQQTLQVAAVIEDLPSNTRLALVAVASGLASGSGLTRLDELAAKAGPGNLQPESVYICARLRPGASIEKLDAAMGRF